MIKFVNIIGLLVFTFQLANAGVLEDFDSLGGNDVLIDRAKTLQPEKTVTVVQDRIVDRNIRHEFSGGYSNVIGGDAYILTQMLNLNYHFHVNPYWTVGLSYFSAYNKLSREGRFLIDTDELVPDIDQPQDSYELVGNFSPIYGKVKLFDWAVLQFDVYGLLSYGRIRLKSGETDTFSLGGGIGLWISQHLTSRLEIRQRFYQAQRFGGGTDIETTVAGISFGYLL